MDPNNLPEHLPGIDLQEGIKHWEDDWEDYFYVLNMFAERRQSTIDDIVNFLQIGSRYEAAELAHAVKGASGNLHLTPTFERARDLEVALRDEQADIEEPLRLFRESLAEAFDSIRRLPNVEPPDENDGTPLDMEQAKTMLQTLSSVLREGVLDESFSPMIREAETLFRGCGDEYVKTLKRQATEFDFDDALCTLKRIADKFGIEIEEGKT